MMNSVAATVSAPAYALAPGNESCFHCGLAMKDSGEFAIRFDGRMRPLCCAGCQAVAGTILDAGLEAYYRNRDTGGDENMQRARLTRARAGAGNGDLVQREVDALFNLNAVAADYVGEPDALTRSADLYIDGITCSACVWLAESALARVPGVTSVTVNQITHRASVRWQAGRTELGALRSALRRVGLDAQPATATARFTARRRQRRRATIELGVALLSMMQVMMFTVPLYFYDVAEVSSEARLLMGWAGLVLTLPVLLVSARSFFAGAWRDLRLGRISMDMPVALAILATFVSSTVSLHAGGNDLYFDSISMFVFLLLAARYLESSARESSLQLIERLTNAAPARAVRINGFPSDREQETVAASELGVGDIIRIATGEAVATDGVVVEGCGEFDESLLTGESRPVLRNVADALAGGSLNLGAPVLMRVTRIGEFTTVASLRRLTEQALAARPRFSEWTDRMSRWIAPLTLLLAGAAALAWWGIDPARSFPVAVAVLAVTCPCAFALAAPAAQALAITRLAREGLLISRSGTLEKIAVATDIVFDKTGTLTEGTLRVESVQALGTMAVDKIAAIAVALEAGSPHPIARAMSTLHWRDAMNTGIPFARDLAVENGAGVAGTVDGIHFRLGTRAFVESLVMRAPPTGITPDATLFLGTAGQWLAAIVLSDSLKADAAESLDALARSGLSAHILSGDRRDRVAKVADHLGVAADTIRAEQTPAQKLDYARALVAAQNTVIAVGDGINDAPLLGAAGVSIAIGNGADLTRLTADAVLLSPHLSPLVTARHVARRMQKIIRQNFAWAIAYNLIAVPLAMSGHVTPAWAATGMALSSLAVVINSLRLCKRSGSKWKF